VGRDESHLRCDRCEPSANALAIISPSPWPSSSSCLMLTASPVRLAYSPSHKYPNIRETRLEKVAEVAGPVGEREREAGGCRVLQQTALVWSRRNVRERERERENRPSLIADAEETSCSPACTAMAICQVSLSGYSVLSVTCRGTRQLAMCVCVCVCACVCVYGGKNRAGDAAR